MDKIAGIKQAIANAKEGKSKLTDECFQVGGFTSPAIRHLLNNLGSGSRMYAEVGVHLGSTFISAMYRNLLFGCAFDNFSEFNTDNPKQQFLDNCNRLLQGANGHRRWVLTTEDFFSINVKFLPIEIDLYLYDGAHDYESQKKAFTHFYGSLTDESIVCIDDYDWPDVSKGTQDGIKEVGFEILFEETLSGKEFHNGFYVALLKKPK